MQLARRLRFEWRRFAAMGLTVLLAVTAFVVLTGSAQTSELRTTATVNANFRSSYDILVRPPGSQSAIERRTGRVRPNYLSGIFGGITSQQVAQIKQINGVQIAAPIAMLGEVLQTVEYPVDVTSLIPGRGSAVLRFQTTEHTMRGLASTPGPAGYLYVGQPMMLDLNAEDTPVVQRIRGHNVPICHNLNVSSVSSPFNVLNDWSAQCWDRYGGFDGMQWPQGLNKFVVQVRFSFPVMLAAVDPKAEAALTGLGKAMVGGRYLTAADGPSKPQQGEVTVPVLASSVSLVDESSTVHIDRLGRSAVTALQSGLNFADGRSRIKAEPGKTVLAAQITAQQIHQAWLSGAGSPNGSAGGVFPRLLFTTSPVRYSPLPNGALAPTVVRNDPSVWQTFQYSNEPFAAVPETASDTSYRTISPITATSGADGTLHSVVLSTVGTFDPRKIRSGPALSKVPLETYQPPSALPADSHTRDLLGGKSLLPDTNPGGYLQAPPLLLTTLSALPALTNPQAFQFPPGSRMQHAPISVVRVRVAGVTGADPVSRERVRLVAEQIRKLTGLEVDITVGSSPHPTTIALPATAHGAPALQVSEEWVQKGVAAVLISAIDRKSLALFVLILLTSAVAVAISATAAVRSRRTELGVLSCLGWRPWTLLRSVLLELTAVGLVAGILGAVLSAPLGAALGFSVSWWRALSAIPVALALILLAGMLPALRAARAVPADAVRPAVSTQKRPSRLRGVASMARGYLRRTPGRVAAAALALALGVASLTVLMGIVFGFHGAVVGTMLGNVVSVQVRGVDIVAGVLLAVLGLGCLAQILYLDIREQAPRYASLQASGWRDRTLGALIVWQAVITALIGAVIGAGLGLAALLTLAPLTPRVWLVAIVLIPASIVAASVVALLPAYSLRKLPTARLLAQE